MRCPESTTGISPALGRAIRASWKPRFAAWTHAFLLPPPPPGFANVLKILNKDSSQEELLYFIQQYGSHYLAEALYGSEFSCTIHFPSKKVQQQLWFQYQKGEVLPGGGQSPAGLLAPRPPF